MNFQPTWPLVKGVFCDSEDGRSRELLNSRFTFPKGHTPSRTPTPREKAPGKRHFLRAQLLGRERKNRSDNTCPGFKATDCLTSKLSSPGLQQQRESCPCDAEWGPMSLKVPRLLLAKP